MVADDEQGAPRRDRRRQAPEQCFSRPGRQVHVLGGDQVVAGRARVPRGEVRVPPVDVLGDLSACLGRVGGSALQRDGGQVDRGDLPAALSEPDGVRALAAADVQCRTGRKLRCLAGQVAVGISAPQRAMGAVALVPERLVELLRHGGSLSVVMGVTGRRGQRIPVAGHSLPDVLGDQVGVDGRRRRHSRRRGPRDLGHEVGGTLVHQLLHRDYLHDDHAPAGDSSAISVATMANSGGWTTTWTRSSRPWDPRLRALRQQRDTTLAELSAVTGISVSTLSRLESGRRRPNLELLLPLAKAHGVPLDELVGAPPTGDPRIHLRPITRYGRTMVPLTRRAGGVQAYKQVTPASQRPQKPEPQVHEGYEWLYVLNGRLRLVLGEQDLVLSPGEAAEFDTRVPHWFGRAGSEPVEFLCLFGRQGERAHIRARPQALRSGRPG